MHTNTQVAQASASPLEVDRAFSAYLPSFLSGILVALRMGVSRHNINRVVGIEGEVGGDLVVSAPTHLSVVPYVTGGVGGLTVFDRAALGIANTDSYLTGNIGGGVKWYAPNGRWGVRGDYRFIAVRGSDSGSAFFGQDDRYGHRVSGGIIINAIR